MSVQGFSVAKGQRESGGLLQPARNVWRVERAGRAHLLVDAAEYYGTLRHAMRNAERTLLIVGWDIDSRTRLVGADGRADDGLPETFGEFLKALAKEKPGLSIKLLLWDYSVIYAMERELLPVVAFRWNTPVNIDLCLDDRVPLGASHHQKIVAIDNGLAFCGGLDITVRRWDTSDHDPGNALRVDPGREPYRPFHDVQMMVDGDAAAALGDLARRRWERAAAETLDPPRADGDPWPRHIEPHFSDISVGIARTEPAYNGSEEVREIAALYGDMLTRAHRWVYVENQFLTCPDFARRLAARLRQVPGLEALLVVPETHHTWLEHRTMLMGRVRFMEILREEGVTDRVRLLHPAVGAGERAVSVMVHSKVMIVDDTILRVGSANLCNRSMGMDSECDIALEATGPEHREAVMAALGRLLGEHCGADPARIVATLRDTGSLFAAMDNCRDGTRGLRPVDDSLDLTGDTATAMEAVADPARPVAAGEHFADIVDFAGDGEKAGGISAIAKAMGAVLFVAALVLLWRYTPLSEFADPERLRSSLDGVATGALAPLVVISIYVLTGFIAFPVTVLIVATAAAFGLWPGLLYAGVGSLASAVATYTLGRSLGANMLRNLIGPRINRIGRGIGKRGVLTVMTIRLVPVAPFMLVNLVAGALRVPVVDYIIGTVLGLAPGILVLSVLGDRVFTILEDPSLMDVAIILGSLAAWIGLALGLQRLLSKRRGSK
ncbi:VTT domain-containing protein [Parvibaculum sp.]|uniref:VTT domain-containing protein n=1 Tax=Parvibaculum sp. TaxID=2024848 RepID=UPI002730D044|nr:VTT domain-containing protein [Parvibaculum sp.]MDP1627713.1 VTT domain-containing protein [Parvibaculum sp.]MDP2150711.1 VTT domain-containing protein [Parvibaculum sp.]MDP3328016.1 VTT domain-containing protein [Parvibaculum sp.]